MEAVPRPEPREVDDSAVLAALIARGAVARGALVQALADADEAAAAAAATAEADAAGTAE
jgi:hypothetical protein